MLAADEAGGSQRSSSSTVMQVRLLASLVVVQAGVCIFFPHLQFASSGIIVGVVKD
jgi:hypothetical protein